MKCWSIRDYKRPYVFVDEIKSSRKGSIVLVAGEEEYEIDTQDGDGADHVVSMLRSLRDPGVIARKLSCGNKTEAGKGAWERLTSPAMTRRQRGQDFATCLPLDATVTPVPAATPTR